MFILFKMCCVNVGICILFYDFILKFLFLYFSDIIEDKLDMMMESKKELVIYIVLMILMFICLNFILNIMCMIVMMFLWN